ncbi:MAG: response regulator [Alphaproteobacteria bacterium]|nr:response regulator [Alphaproteobacteria bacterium]
MKKNIILIIDDCQIYQSALQMIVEKAGFVSEIYGDGMQGMIRTNGDMDHVAAVLLDIYMPEIDGISLLGHLRSKYPGLPIYIISGSDDVDDKTGVLALGAAGYIPKPMDSAAIEHLGSLLQQLGHAS